MSIVRREHENEQDPVRTVHEAAFDSAAEADLVDLLRERADPYIALVEESEEGIVRGHIVFTPVTHDKRPGLKVLGLGPMAVLPDYQRGGYLAGAAGLLEILDDEVVFHWPVVHTPQVGKDITAKYLSAAFVVFKQPSFQYIREIRGKHDAMLEFQVEIEHILVNGVDIIKWSKEGKITDFKVMIRPLKAVNLIHQMMASALGVTV